MVYVTGNTWLGAILPLILHDGDKEKVNALGHLFLQVPIIDITLPDQPSALKLIQERSHPHLVKTHLTSDFFRRQVEQDKVKVILLLRNPKDVLVSYFHMYRCQPGLGLFPGDFHHFFTLFKANKLVYGDQFDWLQTWWPLRTQDNVLVVKYEDMVKDCPAVIHNVAAFCNKDINDQAVERIVDCCSIQRMRNDPMVNVHNSAVATGGDRFYRKGVVGDWRNFFSQEESDYVDTLCKQCLQPMGLTFDFD